MIHTNEMPLEVDDVQIAKGFVYIPVDEIPNRATVTGELEKDIEEIKTDVREIAEYLIANLGDATDLEKENERSQ